MKRLNLARNSRARAALAPLLIAVLSLATLMAVTAAPAAAQDVGEVSEALELDGYFIEDGAEGSVNVLADLDRRSRELGQSWLFVSLVEEADLGNSEFADDLLNAFVDDVTVVVVAPVGSGADRSYDVAIKSDTLDGSEVNDALDTAASLLQPDREADDVFAAVFEGLSGQVAGSGSATGDVAAADSDGGGSGGLVAFVVVIGVIGAALAGAWWWMKRRLKKQDMGDVDGARAEIRAQLNVVANNIVDDGEQIELSGIDQAIAYYREASNTYTEVDELLDETTNLIELAELNDRIDRARWQMEAALAMVEGRDLPPEPEPDKPSACFFDPTHRPGVKTATVRTAAGAKEVNVCALCARKLEKGEKPEPRMIDVHGKRVPAAKAPRSHGGLGMGGIDIFDIVLGGLGAVLAGGGGRRSRGSGGGLGDIFGGRGRRGRSGGGLGDIFGGAGDSGGVSHDWGGGSAPRRRPSERGVFGPDRLPRGASGRPRRKTRSTQRRRTAKGSGRRRM